VNLKSGHHINDLGDYMPKDQVEYYEEHDPLKIGEQFLKDMAGMGDQEVEEIRSQECTVH
jgi:TPP-dependent pyruvate/acetoin dehydrogenase alpha subunit